MKQYECNRCHIKLKEVTIKEAIPGGSHYKTWAMTVAQCGDGKAVIAIKGERGGLKARLYVSLSELKTAIANL